MVSAIPLEGIPEVSPGADLADLIATAAQRTAGLADGVEARDVIVVAHKVISKIEGRLVELARVRPGSQALELAAKLGKDARQVQVVLDESAEVLRAERRVIISQTRHGFVCANAGVDASNSGRDDVLILLPIDPDRSARELRAALAQRLGHAPAVVISDSFGRTWRHGQCDVAIGCAGLRPLEDWRGRTDAHGKTLRATWLAVADEVAAAADLVRGKDAQQPVVLVRGLGRHVTVEDGPGAQDLLRPSAEDLFR